MKFKMAKNNLLNIRIICVCEKESVYILLYVIVKENIEITLDIYMEETPK